MRYTVVTLSPSHSACMVKEINRRMHSTCATAVWGDLPSLLLQSRQAVGDALITPGNSYGDMSGGFDLAVRDYYGPRLESVVQKQIVENFRGELPVGNAIVVPLATHCPDKDFRPFQALVYAPTMRIPKRLSPDSDAVYVSVLAALQAIHQWNKTSMSFINQVWLTSHGVGTGGLPVELVAKQTAMAIYQFEHHQGLGEFNSVAWDKEVHRGR